MRANLVEVKLQALLTWALDGGEWSVSSSDHFTFEEGTGQGAEWTWKLVATG